MIRRNQFITCMQVLAALRDGPMSPSRLAQACNVNYGRLEEFTTLLLERGWATRGDSNRQELYSLTAAGLKYLSEWEVMWNRFERGAKYLTPRQEGF